MKIIFMGTPDFAATILASLIQGGHDIIGVVSQPDRPVGRKKILTPTPVKAVALAHGIPVLQPEKVRNDYASVLALNPDLIITAAYGQIVPKALLDGPPLGCINVHASLLPQYRGGAPIHQAIIDGQNSTGITIMYMDETMDTGDIISMAEIPIEITDDTGSMFEKLSTLGSTLLLETLPKIASGTNDRTPQNHAEATYAYNIKREDEKLSFEKPARALFNQVRGLHPWPVAYGIIDETNVKVFKSTLAGVTSEKSAGEIVNVSQDGIDVACGDGQVLRLLEIQLAGKKRMPLKDVLNGNHPFVVGSRFE